MVDEVPGKDFIQIPSPVDKEVGIEARLTEGLFPVPLMAVSGHQYLPPPPISPRKQGLDISPLGKVVDHLDILFPSDPLAEDLQFSLQFTHFLKRAPLKGSRRLGHKRIKHTNHLPTFLLIS